MRHVYQYSIIREGQIRVLVLAPGGSSEALAGDLLAVELKELRDAADTDDTPVSIVAAGEAPKTFEALSYVWQSAQSADEFTTPNGTLAITASLASSLRRLRLPDVHRVLWADAICIDQANKNEKSYQVALMGDIYSAAKRVICDLGEAADHSDRALEVMEQYWRKWLHTGFSMGEEMYFTGEETADLLGLPLPSEDEAATIEDAPGPGDPAIGYVQALTDRPWFKRLWIIQEFVLGREVTMVCGLRSLSWAQLLAAYLPYRGKPTWPFHDANSSLDVAMSKQLGFIIMGFLRFDRLDRPGSIGVARFGDLIRHFTMGMMTRLTRLPFALLSFNASQTTIPRDRYFGMLALADDAQDAGLYPDYESPLEDVILRYGRYVLKTEVGAEMLLCAGIQSRVRNHPSWARDYTTGNLWKTIWLQGPVSTTSYATAGNTRWCAHFDPRDDTLLHLVGYRLDAISSVDSRGRPGSPSVDSFFAHTRAAVRFLTRADPHMYARAGYYVRYRPTGELVLDAVWKVLLCAVPAEWDAATTARHASVFDFIQLAGFAEQSSNPNIKKDKLVKALQTARGIDQEQFSNMIQGCMESLLRSFGLSMAVSTDKGYFCAVEPGCQPGDELWIIKGMRLPIVLRPSDSRPGTYEMVAGCYVHGVMQGEVLEEPNFKWRGVTLH